MSYDKLVAALRERAGRENEWYEHGGDIIKAAADAIEALQATIELMKPYIPDFFPDANKVMLPKMEAQHE